MKVVMSYLVELENGTKAWLAAGKEVPEGAKVIEDRPMLIPEEGKELLNKETGDRSSGHWMRDGDSEDKWEEVDPLPEPSEDETGNMEA